MHLGPGSNRRKIRYAAILTAFTLVGMTDLTLAAAIVGKTSSVDIAGVAVPSVDEAKASYRRPKEIPFPEANPYTLLKAVLGQKLFFDRRLSGSSAQSCASCHDPGFAWSDGLPVGVGNGMAKLDRRSPSIINVAWGAAFMWDGRDSNLEQQALGPIQSLAEMNMPISRLLERLNSSPDYVALFNRAFPREGISESTLLSALATYERTIVSAQAPFDAWIDGNEGAISEQAKRGFGIFNTTGHCASCHEGWNFTNDSFQDIGIPGADVGRGRLLPQIPKMNHAFKTPGLREITSRGPYMHDGSIRSLEEVVEHYNSGGVERTSRSDLIVPLGLTVQEKLDLVAFLKTLSGNAAPTTVPVFPR
jgi:cytochrome c peroxidase